MSRLFRNFRNSRKLLKEPLEENHSGTLKGLIRNISFFSKYVYKMLGSKTEAEYRQNIGRMQVDILYNRSCCSTDRSTDTAHATA